MPFNSLGLLLVGFTLKSQLTVTLEALEAVSVFSGFCRFLVCLQNK